MEDLIKTEFASPMLTFDSMDASTGAYYYQSGSDSSPTSLFESSPDQSPNSLESFCPNYSSPTFESSPQYYMPGLDSSNLDLSQSNNYHNYPQEFVFSNQPIKNFTGQNILTQSNLNIANAEPKSQNALTELSNLFSLTNKIEDKQAIQAKIKQILMEHFNTKSMTEPLYSSETMTQSAGCLITPPLSPNADNLLFLGSNKSPLLVSKNNSTQMSNQVAKPRAMLSPGLMCMTPPMVKVESLSQSAGVQVQQPAITRKLSPAYLGALDAAANVISDNMAGQSPLAINSSSLQSANNVTQNSVPKIYFETNTSGQIVSSHTSPIYSYKMDPAPFSSIMANGASGHNPVEDDLSSMVDEPKPSKNKKSSKAKSSKTKGKALNGEQKAAMGTPKQSQKRSAHLSAEFRYRTKLNDKISKLRVLVGQKVHLSKSAVLTRSIERIIKLQKMTLRLHETNMRLQSMVAKLTTTGQANSPMLSGGSCIPGQDSSAKLMSIKELTRSLPSNSCPSLGQNSTEQHLFLDQSSLLESSAMEGMQHLQQESTTEEVFDFEQLLDQF